jgi:hypothetical protein
VLIFLLRVGTETFIPDVKSGLISGVLACPICFSVLTNHVGNEMEKILWIHIFGHGIFILV